MTDLYAVLKKWGNMHIWEVNVVGVSAKALQDMCICSASIVSPSDKFTVDENEKCTLVLLNAGFYFVQIYKCIYPNWK